ncbi:MAG TPA: DUF3662 and FHA domain-containing protein [Phototrophicaceae bacterium]|jgi:pSer/pThr/pTyr-binding forkhead associated (FHA) protein|nr:DUF3662 and FHA domain-containing protein [Phototrophicaceae bacterium]
MNEEQLARFEANIERLIESAFANFFGKKLRAQDIALQLARAMEDNVLSPDNDRDDRPLAPDAYLIRLHPQICGILIESYPGLPQKLSQHLVMLASQTGYRMANVPLIELIADDDIDHHQLKVIASHTNRPENSTAGMQKVPIPEPTSATLRAFLMINGERSVYLELDVVNVGRSRDNDIVLDDAYVSRHHLQLRRRFGSYMLFDVHSQGGTFVNGVRVKEHQLQSGDVIQSGRTQLVYLEDNPPDDSQLPQTDILDPVI